MYDQGPAAHKELPATACPNGYSVAADVVVPKRTQTSLRIRVLGLPALRGVIGRCAKPRVLRRVGRVKRVAALIVLFQMNGDGEL